jgi:SAM-dependent methyltransferase
MRGRNGPAEVTPVVYLASVCGDRSLVDSPNDRQARIERLAFDPAACEHETVDRCNLCGTSHHIEVARRDRYGFDATLCICARCGLGFLSPRLTSTEYASFYAGVYRPLVSAYHGRRIDAETVQVDQRDYAAGLVAFLRRTLGRRPQTVLDVGGSTGVVAGAVASAFDATATVLDPSEEELAIAAQAGFETVAGFAESFDPGARRWELVLLCQTIDHLLDVSATLASLRRVVVPEGRLFVDLLDVGFVARRAGAIEGAVKIDHPYYLTRTTARGFFDRVGLDVVAERLGDDGHVGFLLAPGAPREPEWEALRADADAALAEFWRLRADAV